MVLVDVYELLEIEMRQQLNKKLPLSAGRRTKGESDETVALKLQTGLTKPVHNRYLENVVVFSSDGLAGHLRQNLLTRAGDGVH